MAKAVYRAAYIPKKFKQTAVKSASKFVDVCAVI